MSAIEWTDETWNPVTGCTKVSPGCAHCYIEDTPPMRKEGRRFMRGEIPLRFHPDRLDKPLRWRKPRMVFVNSMSDLFHEEVPSGFIAGVFDVMASCPQHTFQVLTKRPERMVEWFARVSLYANLPNVWLGVSIENRRYVGRADLLRQTPAAARFISAEPLLGPLVYDGYVDGSSPSASGAAWRGGRDVPELDLTGIDWLIVGGESGPHHRPCRPAWVRDLRAAAQAAGTAFFFKQWGGRTSKAGGRLLDGRTWDEFPDRAELGMAGAPA